MFVLQAWLNVESPNVEAGIKSMLEKTQSYEKASFKKLVYICHCVLWNCTRRLRLTTCLYVPHFVEDSSETQARPRLQGTLNDICFRHKFPF